MSETNRTKSTSRIKAMVAPATIHGVKTIIEIVQEFGVHPTQVGLWKKELKDQVQCMFDVKRGPTSFQVRKGIIPRLVG